MGLLELFSCTLIDTEEMLRPLPSPFNGYWLVQASAGPPTSVRILCESQL